MKLLFAARQERLIPLLLEHGNHNNCHRHSYGAYHYIQTVDALQVLLEADDYDYFYQQPAGVGGFCFVPLQTPSIMISSATSA